MKYVLIIPDGAADQPLDILDGKTAFEAAHIPHIDDLAATGRMGTVNTTPAGMPCGSDVCTMSLLGYDPAKYHRGRAPLEAAALGIDLKPTDWVFRVNLVTVIDTLMQDHSAGHISNEEGRTLLAAFAQSVDAPGMALYPGVSYRNIMVDSSGAPGSGVAPRDWAELVTTPPHDIPGQPIRKHLPVGGDHAPLLQRMIDNSARLFADHEVNVARRESGELPATHVWPWGQGRIPSMPRFLDKYGVRGAMITAVDLLAGIAAFIGMDRLDVPGQTSYHDTDYAAAGRHAIAALVDYDLAVVHIEAPDEASHAADAATKVASLEAIDRHVVGPIMAALRERERQGEAFRVLLLPDHYTRVSDRKHFARPVPFVIAGHKMRSVVARPFSEQHAEEADLHIAHGHELMEFFLRAGLN